MTNNEITPARLRELARAAQKGQLPNRWWPYAAYPANTAFIHACAPAVIEALVDRLAAVANDRDSLYGDPDGCMDNPMTTPLTPEPDNE